MIGSDLASPAEAIEEIGFTKSVGLREGRKPAPLFRIMH
jgi:hypothetical protein